MTEYAEGQAVCLTSGEFSGLKQLSHVVHLHGFMKIHGRTRVGALRLDVLGGRVDAEIETDQGLGEADAGILELRPDQKVAGEEIIEKSLSEQVADETTTACRCSGSQ